MCNWVFLCALTAPGNDFVPPLLHLPDALIIDLLPLAQEPCLQSSPGYQNKILKQIFMLDNREKSLIAKSDHCSGWGIISYPCCWDKAMESWVPFCLPHHFIHTDPVSHQTMMYAWQILTEKCAFTVIYSTSACVNDFKVINLKFIYHLL